MKKVILHYRAGPVLRRTLANHPPEGWTVLVINEDDDATFESQIADSDVLLHVLRPVSRKDMERAPKLKLIQKIGVGVDTIDLDAAEELGIGVSNMPGTNSNAVAELAIGLMLAVLRQITVLDGAARAGKGWVLPPERLECSGEIGGRTVGFLGFGEVPRRIAPALSALGAQLIYHDLSEHHGFGAQRRSLEDVIDQADILSLHLPLTDTTRHIISAETIAKMRDGAVLINTARGGLVDEGALAEALTTGKLLGAGLDVFSEEPVRVGHPLLSLPNVVATPHVAWLTPETIMRSLDVAFENARRAIAGESLLNEIRPGRR